MKKNKIITLLILTLFSFSFAFGQQKAIIRGRVIDKSDKSPILGANILEYDKDNRVVNGAVCNATGDFVLEIKNVKNTIRVSFIGYKSLDITPNFTGSMIIELESSSKVLDVVEVTAQRKGRSLTNLDDRDKATSSTKMDFADLKESGALSATDALAGKVPGLDILGASGDPGSGSKITIRGLSSLGNSQPLVVIDGIPQSSFSSYASANTVNLASASAEDIGTVLSIPVNDIKSIEVLKDAASTAQYGSRGADGVLLIETQKGQRGRVQVEYSYKRNMNFERKPIPLLNGDEYIMLQREEFHNANPLYDLTSPQFLPIAYDRSYDYFYNYNRNTDWMSAITQNSVSNDNYLKISGGGEKAKYSTSVDYTADNGTTINTSNKAFNIRMNLDYYLSKKLWFSIGFNYNNRINKRSLDWWLTEENGYTSRSIRTMASIKAPNMSIWEYDRSGQLTGEYFTSINGSNYQGSGQYYYNPVAVANLGKNDNRFNGLENSFSLNYTLLPWLTFIETAALQISGTKQNLFLPQEAMGGDWTDWFSNLSAEQNQIGQSFKTNTQLSYNIPFENKKHQLSGILTWVTDDQRNENMQIQSKHLPTSQNIDPSGYGILNSMTSTIDKKRELQGIIAANYKYADKYLVQLTLNENAHSSFGSNHRWGTFYGVATAWRFGKESFVKDLKIIGEESKFRFDYGKSGRQPDNQYARFATYGSLNPSSYLNNINIVPTSIQLDNLVWESTYGYNIGLDLFMFKERFSLTAEIYNKTTKDINNGNYAIPYSSGFDKLIYFNGGQLSNKGWELMMDYFIVKKSDLFVEFRFNISQNMNSYDKFAPNFNNQTSADVSNGQYPIIVLPGRPIGSFYGFKYQGVYSRDADAVAKDAQGKVITDNNGSPIPMTYKGSYVFRGGDAMYEDINHDGVIDINDVVYLGNANPKFIGGFWPSVRYKGFYFSLEFQYRLGFDIANMAALNTQGMGDKNNQSKAVLQRWRAQGQNEPGMLPRAYYGNVANNLGSDRYVEKGDFLRLLNIQFSYTLNQKLCDKLHLKKLSFSVSARRLGTFTNYSGVDPEIGGGNNAFWMGADYNNTPQPKVLSFSTTIGF